MPKRKNDLKEYFKSLKATFEEYQKQQRIIRDNWYLSKIWWS